MYLSKNYFHRFHFQFFTIEIITDNFLNVIVAKNENLYILSVINQLNLIKHGLKQPNLTPPNQTPLNLKYLNFISNIYQ